MNTKHNEGPKSQVGGFMLIELMTVVAIVGTLAATVLPIYNNYMVKLKLIETTTTLDVTQAVVNEAYSFNSGIFPGTNSSPIITRAVASNTQYAAGTKYNNPGTSSGAGVVATLDNTGNVQIDGHCLGMFGTDEVDRTVVWIYATTQTANDSVSGAVVQSMYPYLPMACQN